MIDGKNHFFANGKNDTRTYNKICKMATGEGDDYITVCFIDCVCFKKYFKLIAIDLSKQKALDANPKAIQQIGLTENLDWVWSTTMFFINEKAR